MTTLLNARPHLEVSDVVKTADFFERALEMRVRDSMGDPPVHAILEKDGVTITVVRADSPTVLPIASCYLDVSDVQAAFDRCISEGIDIVCGLQDHPWGMRDFVVRAPDGHLIACGERMP